MINCEKCKSDKVKMYDYCPLALGENLEALEAQFDNQLFAYFVCECDHTFSVELEVKEYDK